jgi:hypothetical protein
MADFKMVSTFSDTRRQDFEIASATVIEAGDMVALTSGLVTKAVAASTQIAFTEVGSADGETSITVVADDRVRYKGTGDAVFAKTQRGTEVDLVGTTTQLIDLGTSVTDVLKVA